VLAAGDWNHVTLWLYDEAKEEFSVMTEINVSGFFNKVINKIRQFIKKVRNCLEFGVQELDREVLISIYQYILVCVATQLHYFTWNWVALF